MQDDRDNREINLIRSWRVYPQKWEEEEEEPDITEMFPEEEEGEEEEQSKAEKDGRPEADNENNVRGQEQEKNEEGREIKDADATYAQDAQEENDKDDSQNQESYDQENREQGNSQEDYDYDEGDYYDSYEDDDYYEGSYDYDEEEDKDNEKAFKLAEGSPGSLKIIFAQLIEHMAEELSSEDTEGVDFWDMKRLLKRSINPHIPLQECKRGKTREKVVLILDTSGSCAWLAQFYSEIAQVAIEHGLIELYEAPNGVITAKWDEKNREWTHMPIVDEEIYYEEGGIADWNSLFSDRTIIFFGDFDGGDSVIEASWKNRVFWFSSEARYSDTTEHDWCHYTLDDFNGEYLACYGKRDFVANTRRILKKLSASPSSGPARIRYRRRYTNGR